MKCPNCESEMEEGTLALKATRWGFVFFGLSYKHLYFKKSGAGPSLKELVLKNGHVATGHKCHSCGTTVIAPDGVSKNLFHW